MFKRLQQRWQVNGLQLFLILVTFALGGSFCGFLGRQIIAPLHIEHPLWYGTVYFLLITLLWPLSVLLVSIPLGQFRFFSNYLRKIAVRFGFGPATEPHENDPLHIRLAIFASGGGSNAQKIMAHFANHPSIRVALLVSNKPGAGALHHAANFGVSTLIIEKQRFFEGDCYLEELRAQEIDFVILAGFLWKVPAQLIAAYPQRILNIHPALLPAYGGKGMYGHHVHQAVLAAGEVQSGITIHLVDEQYDHGATIFQAICAVSPQDTPDTLAQKVLQLEHAHYPVVIEQFILSAQ